MPAAKETSCAFMNARAVQRERLRALEAVLDAGSMRHLVALGVQPGWSCLGVGAGGGSVAAWLCDRAGPEGAVVATDLDTTLLRELTRSNREMRTTTCWPTSCRAVASTSSTQELFARVTAAHGVAPDPDADARRDRRLGPASRALTRAPRNR